MVRVRNKIKSILNRIFLSELRSLRFAIGQSSILASRSNSHTFQNLWDAEVKVYSQWGEDGILDYLCEMLQISKPNVLEIGAGNFSECNSRFLAENRNSNVFAVDGREDLISSIDLNPLKWKSHIFGQIIWVTPNNVNEIIRNARENIGELDIFSLDLDGNDFWILSASEINQVKIVVVEYNPLFGFNKAVSVPRDDQFDRRKKHHSCLYYGASIKAFNYLLMSKGFEFVGTNRVGNNAFFVRKDLRVKIPLVFSDDFSIYTDWRVRETRSKEGILTYTSGMKRIDEIAFLPLVDVISNQYLTVGDTS